MERRSFGGAAGADEGNLLPFRDYLPVAHFLSIGTESEKVNEDGETVE